MYIIAFIPPQPLHQQQLELVGEGEAGAPAPAAAAVASSKQPPKAVPAWKRPLGKRGAPLGGVRPSLFAVSSVMRVAPHDKEAVLRRQLQVGGCWVAGCVTG